jgi:type 1 fimbria pilin
VVLFADPQTHPAPGVGVHMGAVGITVFDTGEAVSAAHEALTALTLNVYDCPATSQVTVIGLLAHTVGDHPPLGCTW